MELVERIGSRARMAARNLAWSATARKDQALHTMADTLVSEKEAILAENLRDVEQARAEGMDGAMLDRLTLTPKRFDEMVAGVRQIASLPDPVGEVALRKLPNTLNAGRMRVPLGVIFIIYESRPNVTADAAALCVKSGNAVILRGGSEAFHSNRAIAAALSRGLSQAGLPGEAVQFVETTDREVVSRFLAASQYIDVVIPRGGKGLIQRVAADSRIPVLKHLDGICHTYVDRFADMTMSWEVVFNAKMQRTGVCNATETLLVHTAVAEGFLPVMADRLHRAGCELRGCEETLALLGGAVPVTPACAEDWDTEHLSAILNVRIVASFQEALDHIERHSSRHTEAILTRDHNRAMRFLREVDSSAVMVNASTRFNDGFQLGLGAEMGISTDKLHVRGPVGLEGLTTLKWIVFGEGQLRQ